MTFTCRVGGCLPHWRPPTHRLIKDGGFWPLIDIRLNRSWNKDLFAAQKTSLCQTLRPSKALQTPLVTEKCLLELRLKHPQLFRMFPPFEASAWNQMELVNCDILLKWAYKRMARF